MYTYDIGYFGFESSPLIRLYNDKKYDSCEFKNFISSLATKLLKENDTKDLEIIYPILIEELVNSHNFKFEKEPDASFIPFQYIEDTKYCTNDSEILSKYYNK